MPSPADNGSTPMALSPWRHLPNALTLARIALVLPLVWSIARHRFDSALGIAAVAGFTDAFDGFLAKRFGWQSWLGGVLDPIADKLLLMACFISLWLAGVFPLWLTGLVVGRDLAIAAGATAYHFLIGRVTPQPSTLSKITTCIQISCVLAVLVNLGHLIELPAPLIDAGFVLTALATAASGVHYVVTWTLKALRARASKEKIA
jgi:cardiolipin synthase (CMP-forming)